MKTIALKEETFQVLQDLKRKENVQSFDELLAKLIIKPKIPDSMFGALKGKIKPFTEKERRNMWKERL